MSEALDVSLSEALENTIDVKLHIYVALCGGSLYYIQCVILKIIILISINTIIYLFVGHSSLRKGLTTANCLKWNVTALQNVVLWCIVPGLTCYHSRYPSDESINETKFLWEQTKCDPG